MSANRITSKRELLEQIRLTWEPLVAALGRLSESQLTTVRDSNHWAAKDHLTHMERWERSVVYVLQGRARHLGLGIDRAVFERGDEDEINNLIFRQSRDVPLADVLQEFHATHRHLMNLVEAMSEGELQQPYAQRAPEAAAEGDDRLMADVIYGNTAHHFSEHLGWIEALVHTAP